jgi:murein DD-endopeptidase MepM/ murein hydrolase activator NlpD
MPTLGANQFGFFGMHTHPGSAMPSGQDYAMTQKLGLDQLVIGTNGTQAIFANNPGNDWQGMGFEFEGPITSNPTSGHKINPPNSAVRQGNGLFRARTGGAHDGIDISGQSKDDVRAAGSGKVIFSGWQTGYGQTIVVDHGDGRYSLYAHLDNRDVKVGQEVAAGETIGGIGTTGNTPELAQTHLHFEIRDGKNDSKHAVDPLTILPGPYFQDHTLVSPNYVSPAVTGPYYTTPTYSTNTQSSSTQSDPITSFYSGTSGSGD